jgi:prophage tail gpP-like protein
MAWKNPTEIARLTVGGIEFTDWTALTVVDDRTQAYPFFSFECTEKSEMPSRTIQSRQIVPGDQCSVSLAGIQVLEGYVLERQVGYEGRQHTVLISGTAKTYNLAVSSIKPNTNGNYDGKTLKEITQSVIAPHQVMAKFFGDIPDMKFEHSQFHPGETVYQFLERHAKMRNVRMGSTAKGELLMVGPHDPMPSGELIEGKNILRAQCVVRDTHLYQRLATIGQQRGHNSAWGDDANKGSAEVDGKGKRPVYSYHPADTPTSNDKELKWRAETQKRFTDGSEIQANITVQGWVQGNGSLWEADKYYSVTSPMLILEGESLGCKKITYDQREGAGTTTTLEMVSPILMNGGRGSLAGPAPSVPIVK